MMLSMTCIDDQITCTVYVEVDLVYCSGNVTGLVVGWGWTFNMHMGAIFLGIRTFCVTLLLLLSLALCDLQPTNYTCTFFDFAIG